MAFLGRLHPLLIHFPIALVISAAVAEAAAVLTGDDRWCAVAVANVRAGSIFALFAAIAGWRLALDPGSEMSSVLEWHRWLGTIGAGAHSPLRPRRPACVADPRGPCGCIGRHYLRRDFWSPLPDISAAYWCGARTSRAHREALWHEWTNEILIDGTS